MNKLKITIIIKKLIIIYTLTLENHQVTVMWKPFLSPFLTKPFLSQKVKKPFW